MRRFLAVSLFAAVAFSWSPRSGAAVVYRSGEGWNTESPAGEDPIEATASEQLRKAEEAENSGDFKRALNAYRGLVRKFPTSGAAAKAQFKAAEMTERAGDYDHAFSAYGDYLTKYPKGDDFDRAVEAQFNIAKRFLEGEKKRVFGVKTLPSMARAQQMFEAIVRNAPFSKYAPQAQFYVGQSLEKQGKDAEAIVAYQAVLSRYGTDPIAADAQYQIGYVHLKNSRNAYDKVAATKAREAFDDFVAHYPSSEKVPQAQENLKALGGRAVSNALNTAKFYDKQKNYKAAVIYYNDVIKQQGGTTDAEFAKTRIAELKGKVGEDALRGGPEKAETGARAVERRRLQAQVDTAARPDFNGPPVSAPPSAPDQVAPRKPLMRTSPQDVGPVPAVEPALPQQ
jgi:outer membrane protein assembly factor BamD